MQTMGAWLQPEPANWWMLVDDAIGEDVGPGDVTSGCVDPNLLVEWSIESQDGGTEISFSKALWL